MLEQLRRQSGSFIIWLIFGIIIAAFVLFFGPQSSGDMGCGATDDFIVDVDGRSLGLHDWRYAMNSRRRQASPAQRQTAAVDAMVARTLLANSARHAGFEVSEEHVVANLKDGLVFVAGIRYPKSVVFDDGVFNYEQLERLARGVGLPGIDSLIAQQREEILANMALANLTRTQVSKEEAQRRYVARNTKISAKYVRYEFRPYQDALLLTDADIDRYISSHEDKVKARYEARKASYQGVKPQVRVRHILVKKASGAKEEQIAAAKKRATELHKKLVGGADFVELARTESEDDRTKNRGGDLGWRPASGVGFGPAVTEAVAKLEDGKLSDVVETNAGFHVLRLDGKREGDLSYDQVKRDLGDGMARKFFAREAARRDAKTALDAANGGKTLEELFPKPDAGDAKEDEKDDKKTGAIHRVVETIPASWGPSLAVGQAGAEGAPAPVAPAPVPAAAAADTATEEYTGELPKMSEVKPPELRNVGPSPREGDVVPGLGKSAELAKFLFGKAEKGNVAGLYELPTGWVIVRLDERTEADLKDFTGKQISIGEDSSECTMGLQIALATGNNDSIPAQCMALKKAAEALNSFLYEECSAAAKAGRIKVNNAFLDDQVEGKYKYTPCGTLSYENALIQVLSAGGQ